MIAGRPRTPFRRLAAWSVHDWPVATALLALSAAASAGLVMVARGIASDPSARAANVVTTAPRVRSPEAPPPGVVLERTRPSARAAPSPDAAAGRGEVRIHVRELSPEEARRYAEARARAAATTRAVGNQAGTGGVPAPAYPSRVVPLARGGTAAAESPRVLDSPVQEGAGGSPQATPLASDDPVKEGMPGNPSPYAEQVMRDIQHHGIEPDWSRLHGEDFRRAHQQWQQHLANRGRDAGER